MFLHLAGRSAGSAWASTRQSYPSSRSRSSPSGGSELATLAGSRNTTTSLVQVCVLFQYLSVHRHPSTIWQPSTVAPKSWCSSYPSPCKVRRALLISSSPGGVPTRVEIMTAASILTRQQEVPCGRAKMRNRSLQLYHPQIPTHISFHRFRLLPSWYCLSLLIDFRQSDSAIFARHSDHSR